MMDETPTVSVLMPVYNAERYLAEAVESILGQTFTDFEFVIVDDGSTDGSLAILEDFAAKDDRIVLISRPNTGIVGALNDGLARCRGEYVARMDADDVALPERFEKQVAYLRGDLECVLVGGLSITTDTVGRGLRVREVELEHDGIYECLLHGDGCVLRHPAVMIKSENLRAIGGYRQRYQWLEDLDLFLRLGREGRLANIPEVLLLYRRHPESVCRHRSQEQNAIKRQLIEDAFAAMGRKVPPLWEIKFARFPPTRADYLRKRALRLLMAGRRGQAVVRSAVACALRPFVALNWRVFMATLRG